MLTLRLSDKVVITASQIGQSYYEIISIFFNEKTCTKVITPNMSLVTNIKKNNYNINEYCDLYFVYNTKKAKVVIKSI